MKKELLKKHLEIIVDSLFEIVQALNQDKPVPVIQHYEPPVRPDPDVKVGSSGNKNKFLTLQEAMSFTGLKKQTLYNLTSGSNIPHYKVGKSLRFIAEDLETWMLSHKVKTNEEIEQEAERHVRNNPFKNGRR